MFERWRKVSSGISEHSKSGAQRQILRTVRVLSDSASKTGSPFKESWLAEGKTERLFVANVPPERLQGKLTPSLKQGEAVLSASPTPSCRLDFPLSPRALGSAQGISPSADGDQRAAGSSTPPPFQLLKTGRHQPPPTREGGTADSAEKNGMVSSNVHSKSHV